MPASPRDRPSPVPESAQTHLLRALLHLEESVRAYLALGLGRVDERLHANISRLTRMLVLAGLVLIGALLLLLGVAQLLDQVLGAPGAGRVLIGLAVLAVTVPFLALLFREPRS